MLSILPVPATCTFKKHYQFRKHQLVESHLLGALQVGRLGEGSQLKERHLVGELTSSYIESYKRLPCSFSGDNSKQCYEVGITLSSKLTDLAVLKSRLCTIFQTISC